MAFKRGALGGPVRWNPNAAAADKLPMLLNQFWYGWMVGDIGGSGTVNLTPMGGTTASLANDSSGYGGSSIPAWNTAQFTEPYAHYGANSTSVAGAARLGWRVQTNAPTMGLRRDSDPILDIVMATGNGPFAGGNTGRYWLGLFDQATTLGTVATGANPSARFMAFRFDTAIPDVNWMVVTRDNGATTVTDTGVPVTNTTRFRLTIRVNQGVVTFQIDGANDVNHSTNVPAAATLLYPHGLRIKDATVAGDRFQMFLQRVIVRVGDATDFS